MSRTNKVKAKMRDRQYVGGKADRPKDQRKNLIYKDGGVYNTWTDTSGKEHHVFFTLEEKKALESAVNTANRKRARLLKSEGELPRMEIVNGKAVDTGDTVSSLHAFNKESDFILAHKSKSLNRFRSKEQFYNYLENLKNVNRREYIEERIDLYQENHAKAIINELHDTKLADALLNLDRKEYMRLVQSFEDVMEIHYVYGSDKRDDKIAQIKAAMNLDDDYNPAPAKPQPKKRRRKNKKK